MVDAHVPEADDLIWLDFNPQAGREQAGRQPAVVLPLGSINLRTSVAYVCPITSKEKGYRFQVLLPSGLPAHGGILCEHLGSLDWRARNTAFPGRMPDEMLAHLREVVRAIAGIPR